MSTRPDVGSSTQPSTATGASLRARQLLELPRRGLRRLSLAQRFLLANLAILLVAGLAVGVWIGDQLERSIVERTASVTALYVESIIEPTVASMADGGELTANEIDTLDAHLASSALAERVRSLRVWSDDGTVVYSPNPELIGQQFPVEEHLADAWAGQISTAMDDLSGEENAWERARWSRLLEIYIPVRQRGTENIIAVAEFYMPPRDIDQQVADARLTTWALVTLAIVAAGVLLYGLVKRGSDTIRRQEAALSRQVGELTALLDRNAELRERVNSAAQRTTTLNERSMRRVSSDLHDGPGQTLSLALLRLDGLEKRAGQGDPPSAAELAEIESILQDAMTDMRSVAAGLRMPELAPLSATETVARAARDHERRTDTQVDMLTSDMPQSVPLSVKIALFRALQESLSNATRHGQAQRVEVDVRGTSAGDGQEQGLRLVVRDDGAGFDPARLVDGEGLGLAGIREQAEILGGSFEIISSVGAGTEVRVWWPISGGSLEG